MTLEYYVSAELADPLPDGMPQAPNHIIVAKGNDDSTWYIPGIACDIPPWPQYLADNPDEKARLLAEIKAREEAQGS